jgi:hypothetical protein
MSMLDTMTLAVPALGVSAKFEGHGPVRGGAGRRPAAYSMISSARSSSACGTVSPIARAVLRLITKS